MKAKTLSLRLDHSMYGEERLRSLLEKAVAITFPAAAEFGERYECKEAAWLMRHAVCAVCEEVIRTGTITVPLEVRFAERSEVTPTPPLPANVIQFESRPA